MSSLLDGADRQAVLASFVTRLSAQDEAILQKLLHRGPGG